MVPESLESSSYFRGDRERLGVHLMLRLTPPRETLSGLDPERVLVSCGVGILEEAGAAVADAFAGSRRKDPGLHANTLRSALGL